MIMRIKAIMKIMKDIFITNAHLNDLKIFVVLLCPLTYDPYFVLWVCTFKN